MDHKKYRIKNNRDQFNNYNKLIVLRKKEY